MTIRPTTVTGPAYLVRTDSPIGRLELTSDGESVVSLSIERVGSLPLDEFPERPNPVLEEAVRQLGEYFAGTRRDFDLPVRLDGTDFQRSVWQQLSGLGWGEVASYGSVGAATGRPTAGRAVGGAVGANPIPIIVPCHRILASNGKITGYSGGNGIPTKAWLLDHEGIVHHTVGFGQSPTGDTLLDAAREGEADTAGRAADADDGAGPADAVVPA